MDRLASVTTFHRIVEENGFAAAARVLRISPAMVSKHLGDLEAHLGVRLLHRTTRRMAMTDAGARFYTESKAALSQLAEAERAVATDQRKPAGLLRVAVPGVFSALHLAPALPMFSQRYPEVQLEISSEDRLVDLLEHQFDLALRIGRMPDSSLIAHKLARVGIFVCGAPSYFARKGVPKTPDDLVRHECLQYEYQWAGNGWELYNGVGNLRTVALGAGVCRSNSGEILRQLAIGGCGLVQLPDFMIGEDLRAGRLVSVLDDFQGEDRWLQVVFPAARHLPAAVRAFVDFCAEQFGAGLQPRDGD